MSGLSKCNAILFSLYCVFLLLMSGFKSAEMYLQYINAFETWLGGDKLMHLYFAMLLSFLALPVARDIGVKNKTINIIFLFIFLIACLLIDELHQAMMSTRYFDWYDIIFGGLGLLAGLTARLFCDRLFSKGN